MTRFSTSTLLFLLAALSAAPLGINAQPATPPAAKKTWYDTFRIRGYAQLRYNGLLQTNDALECDQCDKSWGGAGGLFIRRARIVLQGQVHPRVAVYLQTDFASSVGGARNVAQMRDWYADVALDDSAEFRVRLGQSKVPYSFENLQSSSNRLPLDRADPTNSAMANERDIGVFFMWAPSATGRLFSTLTSEGLKGSGDYGAVAFGVMNGQTANRPEANNSLHVTGRISYPFTLGTQVIEPGIAGYTGQYVVTADQRSDGVKGHADWSYIDQRALASLVLYPKPFGVLAEYNVGRGPEYNPVTDSIETQRLSGGFVTLSYRWEAGEHALFPFARYQVYDGGKKHERDARSYDVHDVEIGVEWHPSATLEFVTEYYIGDRRFEDRLQPTNTQRGQLLRFQVQVNY